MGPVQFVPPSYENGIILLTKRLKMRLRPHAYSEMAQKLEGKSRGCRFSNTRHNRDIACRVGSDNCQRINCLADIWFDLVHRIFFNMGSGCNSNGKTRTAPKSCSTSHS